MVDLLVHIGLIVGLCGVDRIQFVVEILDLLLDLETVGLDGLDDDLSIILKRDECRVLCAVSRQSGYWNVMSKRAYDQGLGQVLDHAG